MDRTAQQKLNLSPRTEQELHEVYDRFLIKWENKARRAIDDRVSRR